METWSAADKAAVMTIAESEKLEAALCRAKVSGAITATLAVSSLIRLARPEICDLSLLGPTVRNIRMPLWDGYTMSTKPVWYAGITSTYTSYTYIYI